ncbi:ABC transporter substrate-binding protein [Variovorax boronicumulans]|uniref:ABC transporter substrate-binding protein n=1 Tax=Variovorax boronicumulans TaxID=436515 RepID=A0A250DMP8_9BURK|nr:tripartite tricarboxylate transporter substrate binding protein [Variovorax boronicumulans]ATA55646.1 ABC transporter substrate-binding protein [Variovorax boronicumulans]
MNEHLTRETEPAAPRRLLLKSCLAAGATPWLASLSGGANAASRWPEKTVRMVVAFPAGGPTDATARLIAQTLAGALGQPVIVDNRPGASGSIGTTSLIKSAPDGYTVSMFGMPALVAPIVYRNNQYDVRKDFTCVASVYDLPLVLMINPLVLPGVNDLKGFIAAAKAQPVNYSTAGSGSIGHLAMEQLKDMGGFPMQHVGYKGSAPAITDLLGGQIGAMFVDLVAAMPHIRSGRLKALALGSADARTFLPEVPSIAQQGFAGFNVSSWSGLIVPNGTPAGVVTRLDSELRRILAEADTKRGLENIGALSAYQPPEVMKRRMASEFERWNKVASEKDISI